MTLFGFTITSANQKAQNELNAVNREECHSAMTHLNVRIDDLKKHIDDRFEDIKDLIKTRR